MSDLLYNIALTQLAGIGPVSARQLIAYCGSAEAVFQARKKDLLRIPGIGEHAVSAITGQQVMPVAEQELKFIERHQIRALFYTDDDYPQRLKGLPDAPILLYYRGTAGLNPARAVAVVGTRKPSPQGLQACQALIEGLRPYGVQVISGLAFGIDICAHRRCLDLDIPTVGVLGHGLSMVYPAQHRHIAERMSQAGGLLTEYISSTQPEREHFPMRNRIVAGLCDALVVVETARKGGSMITACMANEYHKDVFAMPGRIRDVQSQGCNLLIKSHRAALAEHAQDIAYVMGWEAPEARQPKQTQLFVELTEDEKLIVDLLRQNEGQSIDGLAFATSFKGSTLANLLLNLECKGMIKTLPGKRYTLI